MPANSHRLRRRHPHPRLLPLVAAIGAFAGSGAACAQFAPVTTLPSTPTLRAGTASVSTNVGTSTQTITQTSSRAVIDWGSFSIGRDATVQIAQPDAQSVLLNRVVNFRSPQMSFIEGTLNANGRVFLVNIAGILFGPDAHVNVGGLLASTLDIVDGSLPSATTAFLSANSVNLVGSAASPIYVLPASGTQPQIQAAPGGEVLLIGNYALGFNQNQYAQLPPASFPFLGSVNHAGIIAAQAGRVHLAAGDSATVGLPVGASGFVTLSNIGAAPRPVGVITGAASSITNPGGSVTLEAVSQPTFVSGPSDSAVGFQTFSAGIAAVFADGTLSARNETAQPTSRIDLRAAGGRAEVAWSGTLDVSGSTAAATGGSIGVAAQYIAGQSFSTPATTALLDANGAAGGGNITLGDSSTRLLLIPDTALLRANATTTGDGGRIAALATYYNPTQPAAPVAGTDYGLASIGGRFEAIGLGSGHRGGSIETSAAALNIASARVDASGQGGASAGQWRIDPYDVTISNAAPTAVDDFAPTAPGANLRAADIGNALDTGTDVFVGTGSGGPPNSGTITILNDVAVQRSTGSAPVTLTLAGANAVVLNAGSRIASSAGPLNVTLTADADGSGFGGIRITGGNTRIATRGGNVALGGGTDPASGYARGTALYDAGIDLNGVTIDTRGSGIAGDVILRGQGYLGSGYDTPGVRLANTRIDANDIAVLGRSGDSSGVQFNASTQIATGSGTIAVRGIADPGGSISSNGAFGVTIAGPTQLLTGTGSLYLAGRGASGGLVLDGLLVGSADNAGGRITIAGQTTGGSNAGVRFSLDGGGFEIRGASSTDAFSGADIVIGAKAAAGAANALDLGPGVAPRVLTRGHLNLRPLGVDANGNTVEDAATPIYIGSTPNFATSPPTNFIVDPAWLTPVAASAAGVAAEAGIVIGSSLQSGRITLDDASPVGSAALRLSLQNEAAGSGGITLGAALTTDTLGLLSAGDVTQAAALTANRLLVRAAPSGSVDLSNASNRIGTLAFDAPRALTVRTQGTLTIGSATTAAFDTAGDLFTSAAITGSRAGDRTLLQSLDADLVLAQPISLTGAASQLDLVAANLFQNPAGATLANGTGGAWRIWSQTWQGSARGGLAGTAPAANLYGCAFGDTASCSLSGAPIPAGGDRFLYRDRPTLAVTADNQTVLWHQPVPTLTYAASGLVNADPMAEALAGAPSTTVTATSPVQAYPIDAGTLAARDGYRLAYTPGVLEITAPTAVALGTERTFDFAGFATRQRSDLYGINFSLPNICTAASFLSDVREPDAPGVPPLTIEWARVRNQPQLTSCLNERDASECAGF